MGRGRQKAKQTKVARELKYYSPDTDYSALQAELSYNDDGSRQSLAKPEAEPPEDEEDEYADKYGSYGN